MRDRRRSQRFLQRQHRVRLPEHLHRFLPHRLGSLLRVRRSRQSSNGETIDTDWTGTLQDRLRRSDRRQREGSRRRHRRGNCRVQRQSSRTAPSTYSIPQPSPSAARRSPATWPTLTPIQNYEPRTPRSLRTVCFYESEFRSAPYFDVDDRRHQSARHQLRQLIYEIRSTKYVLIKEAPHLRSFL